jgi:hypothetical protein
MTMSRATTIEHRPFDLEGAAPSAPARDEPDTAGVAESR